MYLIWYIDFQEGNYCRFLKEIECGKFNTLSRQHVVAGNGLSHYSTLELLGGHFEPLATFKAQFFFVINKLRFFLPTFIALFYTLKILKCNKKKNNSA